MYTATGVKLGDGRFGHVVEVSKDGVLYARKEFIEGEMSYENKAMEREMMERVKGCPHLIQLVDVEENGDLVMERMDGSLWDLMREFQCVPEPILQDMTHHVLSGLMALKRCGIVHCDLKPENILYRHTKLTRSGYAFVIGDLGNANEQGSMTRHFPIQTTEYRCIENVLGTTCMDTCCDMMSLGLILFEAVVGCYIVHTNYASSEEEQTYKHVMNVLDAVGKNRLARYDTSELPELETYLHDVVTIEGIDTLFPYYFKRYGYLNGEQLIDLIQSMLVPFPLQRIRVVDAMMHPWLTPAEANTTDSYPLIKNSVPEIDYFFVNV